MSKRIFYSIEVLQYNFSVSFGSHLVQFVIFFAFLTVISFNPSNVSKFLSTNKPSLIFLFGGLTGVGIYCPTLCSFKTP